MSIYEEAEAFFAQDGWDGAEPHVVAVAFLEEMQARASAVEASGEATLALVPKKCPRCIELLDGNGLIYWCENGHIFDAPKFWEASTAERELSRESPQSGAKAGCHKCALPEATKTSTAWDCVCGQKWVFIPCEDPAFEGWKKVREPVASARPVEAPREATPDDLRNAALEEAATIAEYHHANHCENGDGGYRNCGTAIATGIRDLKSVARAASSTPQTTSEKKPRKKARK
jgi:hypothetical protein